MHAKKVFHAILCKYTCETVLSKSLLQKMAKMRENTIPEKYDPDDGVRPSTSKRTLQKEVKGPKKMGKKGEHSKWISFLNDFNMQYIPIKIIMK